MSLNMGALGIIDCHLSSLHLAHLRRWLSSALPVCTFIVGIEINRDEIDTNVGRVLRQRCTVSRSGPLLFSSSMSMTKAKSKSLMQQPCLDLQITSLVKLVRIGTHIESSCKLSRIKLLHLQMLAKLVFLITRALARFRGTGIGDIPAMRVHDSR
jgi:hypothetical protein